jgi:hypothetical protein
MDDALGVRGDKSESDCLRDRQRARQRNASFFSENGREILAFDVRHRDVLDAVDFSKVVNSDDVLVRDLPGEEQLTLETPLQVLGVRLVVGNLRSNHLQCDRDAKLGVPRFVDGAHAAEAKQSGDAIPGPEVRADGQRPGSVTARRARPGTESSGVATQPSGVPVSRAGPASNTSGVGVRRRGAAPKASGISVLARSVRNQTGCIGRVTGRTQELRRVLASWRRAQARGLIVSWRLAVVRLRPGRRRSVLLRHGATFSRRALIVQRPAESPAPHAKLAS